MGYLVRQAHRAPAVTAPVPVDESLPRACVIDVGYIEGRGWACVEQNAAWGAGLYACDAERALEVIRHASVRER